MTKKDSQLIAETLRSYPFTNPQDRVGIACHFADRLAKLNARFNQPRFISAATGGDEQHIPKSLREWLDRGSPVVGSATRFVKRLFSDS